MRRCDRLWRGAIATRASLQCRCVVDVLVVVQKAAPSRATSVVVDDAIDLHEGSCGRGGDGLHGTDVRLHDVQVARARRTNGTCKWCRWKQTLQMQNVHDVWQEDVGRACVQAWTATRVVVDTMVGGAKAHRSGWMDGWHWYLEMALLRMESWCHGIIGMDGGTRIRRNGWVLLTCIAYVGMEGRC